MAKDNLTKELTREKNIDLTLRNNDILNIIIQYLLLNPEGPRIYSNPQEDTTGIVNLLLSLYSKKIGNIDSYNAEVFFKNILLPLLPEGLSAALRHKNSYFLSLIRDKKINISLFIKQASSTYAVYRLGIYPFLLAFGYMQPKHLKKETFEQIKNTLKDDFLHYIKEVISIFLGFHTHCQFSFMRPEEIDDKYYLNSQKALSIQSFFDLIIAKKLSFSQITSFSLLMQQNQINVDFSHEDFSTKFTREIAYLSVKTRIEPSSLLDLDLTTDEIKELLPISNIKEILAYILHKYKAIYPDLITPNQDTDIENTNVSTEIDNYKAEINQYQKAIVIYKQIQKQNSKTSDIKDIKENTEDEVQNDANVGTSKQETKKSKAKNKLVSQ